MTNNFSETDQKLLAYLKAKSRFTSQDSIMAARRTSLTESWHYESDEGEHSEHSAMSLVISDDAVDTSQDIDESGGAKTNEQPSRPATTMKNSQTNSDRLARSINMSADRPLAQPSSSEARKKPSGSQAQQDSAEPQFIMPSMHSSSFSASRASPLSKSIRSRQMKKSPKSSRLVSGQARSSDPKKKPTKAARSKPAEQSTNALYMIWSFFIGPVLRYALGVLGFALAHLKPLFGFFFAIFLVILAVQYAFRSSFGALSGLLGITGVTNIIPPMCSIPGVNLLPMCSSTYATGATPEFEELVKVQSTFEDILKDTAQGSILPIEMKRSEAAIRDLKMVVTYSHLPSRNELVHEFEGFIDLARAVSADLTRFNVRVGRAVDTMISTNKHTLQVIDGFVDMQASQGVLSRWIWGANGLTNDHLIRQFLQHTDRVEGNIAKLILEAKVLLGVIEELDSRLDAIADVVVRDGVRVKASREELMSELWTYIGGNRNSVKKLDDQLRLLRNAHTYRKMAWTHITATLMKLQQIGAGLEDLRERIALPETVGEREGVSLQQHIETIQMGLDRLEKVRDNSRSAEADVIKKVLGAESGTADKGKYIDAEVRVIR